MTGLDGINSLHKMLGALQGSETKNVGGPSAASPAKTAHAAGLGAAMDHTSLSAAGGLAAQAMDTSDVRVSKVAELRQAITSGTYNVAASAVADKMVEGLLK